MSQRESLQFRTALQYVTSCSKRTLCRLSMAQDTFFRQVAGLEELDLLGWPNFLHSIEETINDDTRKMSYLRNNEELADTNQALFYIDEVKTRKPLRGSPNLEQTLKNELPVIEEIDQYRHLVLLKLSQLVQFAQKNRSRMQLKKIYDSLELPKDEVFLRLERDLNQQYEKMKPKLPRLESASIDNRITTAPPATTTASAPTIADGAFGGIYVGWEGKRFEVPKGNVYRVIEYMWNREFANYDTMMDNEIVGFINPQTFRSIVNTVNNTLKKIGIPWRIKTDSGNRLLSKKSI